MDKCPRCGADAVFAGYEDARTFYQCEKCKRVWPMMIAPTTSAASTPVRVLIADDSDLLVGLVGSWLEEEGYAVVGATSGRQTLDAAALHRPDVVLLDLIMPQMDGFEVCGKLKALQDPPEIVLMTGISQPEHLDRAMDLCAATLLRKPLEPDTVVAAVASAVRRRKHPTRTSTNSHS